SLWRLAKIQITRDEKTEALATLEKAIGLNPTSIELKLEVAKLFIRLGAYEKALRHLEAGLGLNEFHQELIAYQVMCWRLLGDEQAGLMNNFDAFVVSSKIPVPDGYKDLAEFNKALLRVLDDFHKPELSPLGQSLRHGTQTLTSLFSMEVKEIQEARQALSKTIKSYIEGLPDSKTHPFLKRKNTNFEFSGSWSIQLKDQGFHINHVHPEGWISTSYYVDVPRVITKGTDHGGCIKFGESPLKLGEREEIGKIIRPEVGLLVMFPSYMFHGTFPFSSPETRTTMPFDIIPV
ncbi:MAG: putative 2OG-Fe(II) oxygenase, partial [Sphingomonadales bacterium]